MPNEEPSGDYWVNLNVWLVSIPKHVARDAECIAHTFNYFLKEDHKYTAVDVYELRRKRAPRIGFTLWACVDRLAKVLRSPWAWSSEPPKTAKTWPVSTAQYGSMPYCNRTVKVPLGTQDSFNIQAGSRGIFYLEAPIHRETPVVGNLSIWKPGSSGFQ
ncbi:hypothetical protein GGX14DRAFT_545096 [Mycena pura]|uniref:Uncharacterized protein n=1 Tax=Mycena pura TaxID=153505 RepID=A0AAD6V0N8_9AGAR|nr:hypothetical protein GGX14DRAFT_545096 [Mycena pura]